MHKKFEVGKCRRLVHKVLKIPRKLKFVALFFHTVKVCLKDS